jgi:hypothetical protein
MVSTVLPHLSQHTTARLVVAVVAEFVMVVVSVHLLTFTFLELFKFLQTRISWLKPWLKMTDHTWKDLVSCCNP